MSYHLFSKVGETVPVSYYLNVAILNIMLTITSGKRMHTQQQEFQTVSNNKDNNSNSNESITTPATATSRMTTTAATATTTTTAIEIIRITITATTMTTATAMTTAAAVATTGIATTATATTRMTTRTATRITRKRRTTTATTIKDKKTIELLLHPIYLLGVRVRGQDHPVHVSRGHHVLPALPLPGGAGGNQQDGEGEVPPGSLPQDIKGKKNMHNVYLVQ